MNPLRRFFGPRRPHGSSPERESAARAKRALDHLARKRERERTRLERQRHRHTIERSRRRTLTAAAPMLFVAAKVGHLAHLPQGQPERERRVRNMVAAMDSEGFGSCRNYYECEAVCPKEISVRFIAEMNRDYARALTRGRVRA